MPLLNTTDLKIEKTQNIAKKSVTNLNLLNKITNEKHEYV